ncbi:GIY-YIG nuclease family protein [Coraliomargarita algicola]|uniref:GIY-YIG nuclease family protein n=1 Tax=Coraliomargarita algicola TaxID=3092156 RepID=A0ABZ0RSI3_9BACT|nr:GIY-YIG nuclease family protein [Coraliomargarita sp. J2-16]WPJ98128.1 GIY-YIG nuclease family protein [Coraliomargarita sp. J2-16]
MDAEQLKQLIADDDLGLLDVKPVQSTAQSAEERLIDKFHQITEFYRLHAREPEVNPSNMQEAQLAMSLSALRKDEAKLQLLQNFDEFGLLATLEPPASMEDIYNDDDLGLLDDPAPEVDIFNLKHVRSQIEMPDYIAQREACEDFDRFEPLFKNCHQDLRSGKRQMLPFANEQQIETGQFFVLKGIMAYVAAVGEKELKGGKVNARMRCIFENGTESAMLLRSLARELYKDGRRITEHEDRLVKELDGLTDTDQQTGTIYVLRSRSQNPKIAQNKDLYKIGYSRGSVEERIKNAADDPTYLMAPVRIVTSFECYNLNPQKLELLLHKFFAKACLEIDVFDDVGKRHTPREWFVAPLAVIEEAIRLTLSEEIPDYFYDAETKLIRMAQS